MAPTGGLDAHLDLRLAGLLADVRAFPLGVLLPAQRVGVLAGGLLGEPLPEGERGPRVGVVVALEADAPQKPRQALSVRKGRTATRCCMAGASYCRISFRGGR